METEQKEVVEVRKGILSHLDEFAFTLQKFRLAHIGILVFICALTWDFHQHYKTIALELKDWQLVPVFGYFGTLLATIKYMFDNLKIKVKRDEG